MKRKNEFSILIHFVNTRTSTFRSGSNGYNSVELVLRIHDTQHLLHLTVHWIMNHLTSAKREFYI